MMKVAFSPANKYIVGSSFEVNETRFYFRGNVVWKDKLYVEEEFHNVLKDHYLEGKLIDNIPAYNGVFSLIVLEYDRLLIVNDRYGFYPIFYRMENDLLMVSVDYRSLVDEGIFREDALVDYFCLGYVQGDKTLLEEVIEVPPHTILEYTIGQDRLIEKKESYYHFKLTFEDNSERRARKAFVDIWNCIMDRYADHLNAKASSFYAPLSGGLDSRLINAHLDYRGVSSYTMTQGCQRDHDEINTALKVSKELKNVKEHIIQINDADMLSKFEQVGCSSNRITSGYPSEIFFLNYDRLQEKCDYHIPGHSGDFVAGAHLGMKMKLWKSKDDVIDYIIKWKSSTLTQQLSKHHMEIFRNNLAENMSVDDGIISGYLRWNLENRQRRYIVRQAIPDFQEGMKLLLPFYDNALVDLFSSLSMRLLLNQRLYVNAHKDLYRINPSLYSIGRDGKKIKKIWNNWLAEFGPKINMVIKKKLGIYSGVRTQLMHSSVKWANLIDESVLPNETKTFRDYQLGQWHHAYFYSIQKVVKDLNEY